MSRPMHFATAALVAGSLAFAGCGGDDDKESNPAAGGSPTTTPAETSEGGSAAPAASGPLVISMKNIQFEPKEQTAKVGQKVTWRNDESVPHNVVAEEGADFESETFGEGKTYDFTPTTAGTIKYVCTLHPGMDGTLEVTE